MSWKDRHTVVPAVYILLQRGDQILLARRFNTGYQDGKYSLPAGHLDGGEPARDAMVREAREEVNVTIVPDSLTLVHTIHRLAEEGDHERRDLFFAATIWQGTPRIMETNKCDDLQWCTIGALPDNVAPEVIQALQCVIAGEPYSEAGF